MRMDVYVYTMYSLSFFGFFIIFFSLYLFFNVPTKLCGLTKFVIHGHDMSSGLAQLYMTVGTIPHIIFPCLSGYPSGLLNYIGMSCLTQTCSQIALLTVSTSFSLLLTINRAIALFSKLKKWKNLIVTIFIGQVLAQLIFIIFISKIMSDGGDEARKICFQISPYEYPIEMYTHKGVDLMPSKNIGVLLLLSYMGVFVVIYLTTAIIIVLMLVRSIRDQVKSSQSVQFLANQRRITIGLIYFLFVEIAGLGIPVSCISICGFFHWGNPDVSHYTLIIICVYPIFGPYYVLMSNRDYRNRVDVMMKKVWKDVIKKSFSTNGF